MTPDELLAKAEADDNLLAKAEGGGGPRDPRGRAYDPRFAPDTEPEPQTPGQARKFAPADMTMPFLPEAAGPTKAQSFARGGLQGATMGFGDEAAAAIDYGVSKIPGVRSFADLFHSAGPSLANPDVSYAERRDAYRQANKEAKAANPFSYGAGEVAGGLATAPVLPGGGGVKLIQGAKAAALQGAKAGAQLGAAAGLGYSDADLTKGEFAKAFSDAGKSAAAGLVTGGALGAAMGHLVANAEKNAAGWVVKDVVGEAKGASTATARKQLQDDAEAAAKIVVHDGELNGAISKARHGGVDELQSARDVVTDRRRAVWQKLEPLWKKVDKELPEGGVRSGDVIDHLEGRIGELRASGLTTEGAEADALAGIVNRLKGAKDWGKKPIFNAEQKVAGGGLDGMKSGEAIKLLEKQRNAAPKNLHPEIDGEISRIKEAATTTGFDPNHIVPARQIQKLWSDEAGIAYGSMGGINGTQAFTRKLDVAGHIRDFRDAMLDSIAGAGGDVAELRRLNQRYSAYKRIDKVLEQRLNSAKGAGPASGATNLKQAAHKLAHGGGLTGAAAMVALGHPIIAAGMLGTQGAMMARRMADRGLATTIGAARGADSGGELARRILSFTQRGVPLEAAAQAARLAAPEHAGAQALDAFTAGAEQ